MNAKYKFEEFPRFELERVILRRAEDSDSEDLYKLYSDEDVVKYIPFSAFASIQEAKDEMGWYTRIFAERSGMRWMIEDKQSGRVIGTCGFLEYEKEHNRAEIGYDLAPGFWGRGIMGEVINRVLEFGFAVLKLNRIEAKVEPDNLASARLLDKLGFVKEGVLRQHEFEKGRYVDLAVYSILSREYSPAGR